jgi:electron transfer flavoprotein beta subunit
MTLVACILRVEAPHPDVDPLTGAVERGPSALVAPDAAGLEHALRIAEAWRADLLAVGVGEAGDALREAAALGAEIAWVRSPPRAAASPLAVAGDLFVDERPLARAIAGAVRGADLVVCGDWGTGALPAFLAHELGAAQALGLVSLRVDGSELVGERRLDGGRRERLRIPRRAVCSLEAAGVRLRRAPLAGLLEAHAIRTIAGGAEPLPLDAVLPGRPRTRVVAAPGGSAHERLLALTGALVAHDPPAIIGPVGAAEAADALLDFLRRNGYLDSQ